MEKKTWNKILSFALGLMGGLATWLIFLSLWAALSSCATVQDCSVYPAVTAERCKCLRGNEDYTRATQCSRELSDKMREQELARCLRTGYEDCSKFQR